MIVPFTKGAKSAPQNQPSEAMLLMALAHMKGLDRIPSNDRPPFPDTKALKQEEKNMEGRQLESDMYKREDNPWPTNKVGI